jgi:hypothetical protein
LATCGSFATEDLFLVIGIASQFRYGQVNMRIDLHAHSSNSDGTDIRRPVVVNAAVEGENTTDDDVLHAMLGAATSGMKLL